MQWSFIQDDIIENFDDQGKIFKDESRYSKQTETATFCKKGEMYSDAFRKCDPCPPGQYQDNPNHRLLKCEDHPDIPTSICPNGQYNDLSDQAIQEKRNGIADRTINAGDLCKNHATFDPNQCNAGRYIKPNYNSIRNNTKDKALNEADYCLNQPTAASIECADKYYMNTSSYNSVVSERTKVVTAADVCELVSVSGVTTSVSQTSFNASTNTRSFKTIRFTGKVNWDGKVTIIRTDHNNNDVSRSPHTIVNVQKNQDFNISRTETGVGDHYYRIYFADSKGRRFTLKKGIKVHLYNFNFALDSTSKHVRKGSNNFSRPGFKGSNYHNVANNENTFNKNQAKVQHVTYTARNSRGPETLSAAFKVTVYNCSGSVKHYANQNVKVGSNHNTLGNSDFHRDNMEFHTSSGYPGKNHNTNDQTFTVTHTLRDTRDHGHKIDVTTKIRKYKFSRHTFKDISSKKGQQWGWHSMISGHGNNSQVTHAQWNVHPWHGVHHNNTNVKNSIGSHKVRFHTRNAITHGEGHWAYATAHVAPNIHIRQIKVRMYLSYYYASYYYSRARGFSVKDQHGNERSAWWTHGWNQDKYFYFNSMAGNIDLKMRAGKSSGGFWSSCVTVGAGWGWGQHKHKQCFINQ